MQIRFDDFTYEITLPEEIAGYQTIKTILQPILENAIYHGLHPLPDGGGHIIITASDQGRAILITVTDNGIGIPDNILEHIQHDLTEPIDDKKKGKLYGLKNVHARIRLTYKEPFGITIESDPDVGTVVSVLIPKISETDLSDFQKGE